MNLANVVRFWARWNPDCVAIRFQGRDQTYGQLDDISNRIANGLAGLGVTHGDRVGILAKNCPEFCETVIACLKRGAMVVPLNIRLVPRELEYIISDAACKAVVAHPDLLPGLKRIQDSLGKVQLIDIGNSSGDGIVPFETLTSWEAAPAEVEIHESDVAFICYTSGTTGLPKGAMLSHRNIWAQAIQRNLTEGWTSEDRIYLPFPLAFTGGMITLWMPTYITGAMIVLDDDFEPGRALRIIEQDRITIFAAVPVIWEAMARHPNFLQRDLSSLRRCFSGGAPVPESLIKVYQERGLPMSQAYGLTEGAGLNLMLGPSESHRKIGFAGIPSMQEQCRVVRSDGADCAPGEVGELLIKGAEVMTGYWNNPKATAETIVDGWLHTGDLALMDEEGYFKIVDRAKDMLISGGLNVYPAEIERVIAAFPGIQEVAVIGVLDEKWGEVPAAIIHSSGADLDKQAIRDYCRKQLADYKLPRHIRFRNTPLPRNMSGKVLKSELRKEIAEEADSTST